jgi:hypothetical protein
MNNNFGRDQALLFRQHHQQQQDIASEELNNQVFGHPSTFGRRYEGVIILIMFAVAIASILAIFAPYEDQIVGAVKYVWKDYIVPFQEWSAPAREWWLKTFG